MPPSIVTSIEYFITHGNIIGPVEVAKEEGPTDGNLRAAMYYALRIKKRPREEAWPHYTNLLYYYFGNECPRCEKVPDKCTCFPEPTLVEPSLSERFFTEAGSPLALFPENTTDLGYAGMLQASTHKAIRQAGADPEVAFGHYVNVLTTRRQSCPYCFEEVRGCKCFDHVRPKYQG